MNRPPAAIDIVDRALAGWRKEAEQPLVMGLCGAQGSGKSTLADRLEARLAERGPRTAILSLDDLYLPREARTAMARDVHPLFRTRGVPGTHDVPLGLATLDALIAGRPVRLPRFDKARDTRLPEADWPVVEHPVDIVLFEGWCVGARPEPDVALAEPINMLERDEDGDGRWRRAANHALAGAYQALFARIDRLVFLAAPGFDVVAGWRTQQEHDLRARTGQGMGDEEVARFVLFYERLTRHILREMPARADLVIRLDRDRGVIG